MKESNPAMRQRLRIRFRKEAELRFISHRDLARLWERMFRRTGVRLAMSEGYHPKAKLSFPSALSLGIAGWDEVLEIELDEEVSVEDLRRRLSAEAPDGLTISSIRAVPPGSAKAQVVRASYVLPVPADRERAVRQGVESLLASEQCLVQRRARDSHVDVRRDLEHLELRDGQLMMTLKHRREASGHPRDVLRILGLDDLEASGTCLTRTRVELA